MNSEDVHHQATAQDAPEQSALSPGTILKRAREQQGLSQQDIAAKIFVKATTVEDIENDKIDDSMSVTFTKGYVRNYAKHLGLDDAKIIRAFENTHTTTEPPAELQSFSRKVSKQAHDDRWMMVTYVIFFLLVAGVVAWWYQQDDNLDDGVTASMDELSPSDAGVTASPRTASPAGQTPNNDERSALEPTSSVSTGSAPTQNDSQVQALTQETTDDVTTVSSTVADQPDTTVNSAGDIDDPISRQTPDSGVAEPNNADAGTAQMTFSFGEDCWVNIEDASGEVIATGVKRAGRVMPITGQPPVSVTLGAPDNVEITFNGESVDISEFQNGRTARFSLPMQE
ncbi:RodZ domain-containing protein [Salinimonas chungwhensis]|uniref:RodZ domain-containing protein n=1 Tax=Salinimonas chungwhensis TaxID=265425 RepID=UPI0003618336|nr:RodZ domain-containing protein [Salinimonas chungwhensis]